MYRCMSSQREVAVDTLVSTFVYKPYFNIDQRKKNLFYVKFFNTATDMLINNVCSMQERRNGEGTGGRGLEIVVLN